VSPWYSENRKGSVMKRLQLTVGCVLALVISASLSAGEKPSGDAAAIQGRWKPVKAEMAGRPLPEAFLKSTILTMDHGVYAVVAGGEPDRGTYTLFPEETPKGMSVTGKDGPNLGRTFPAIYELSGDTLRICYDLSGAKRPGEFASPAGTKQYLVTYIRVKK
jgi:uncharacterized protein (TIGR03067 family)